MMYFFTKIIKFLKNIYRDVLYNDQSSDDDDSDEPESFNSNDGFLSNEPLARRCDICHKVYRDEYFLNIHKGYTHMPEEHKIPCSLSSYGASRKWALKVYMGLAHAWSRQSQ